MTLSLWPDAAYWGWTLLIGLCAVDRNSHAWSMYLALCGGFYIVVIKWALG